MKYRQLGRSGLRVSTIVFGTMTFGGKGVFGQVGNTDLNGARELVDVALDAGVNLFDTSNIYSNGLSEEILGEVLSQGGRRERALIATKVRMALGEGQNDGGLSRQAIVAHAEQSLRRLRTDHIDLYQLHHWDGQTPLEETLSALDTLVRDGKVRYVGASNFSGWQLMKALWTSDRLGYENFVSQQIHYTLQAREAEYELLPIAVDAGVGVISWSPLAGGLLTGKYRPGVTPEGDARQLTDWDEPPVRDQDKLYDTIDALVSIGEARGVSAAQIALAWLLARPGVTAAIVGARTKDQLADNVAAAEVELTDDELSTLNAVSAPDVIYPYWQQAKSASDRLGHADIVPNEVLRTS